MTIRTTRFARKGLIRQSRNYITGREGKRGKEGGGRLAGGEDRTKSTDYLSGADEGSIINISETINQKTKRKLTLVNVVLGLVPPMPMT